MPWNPEQYERFKKERTAPFDDLIKLVKVRPGLRAIDLGCGTGELTRRLADMLPESDVLGIDSSAEMLERSAEFVRSGLRFEQHNITDISGAWDLVFSNAAIQWIDDHDNLIPRLLSLVRSGGQLVVQLPSNHTHPTHIFIRELAGQEPYKTALNGWSRESPVLTVDRYADLLYKHGGHELTVFEKVYPHVLPEADAAAEWTKGTALVPYMERLPEDLRDPFMQAYRAKLRAYYGEGEIFYGFRRTLFAATV